jgi:hypothetical protein
MIFTVLARQVLVQSLPSSRARSKRVMNQTMFDVPGPLFMHVPLLSLYNVIFATLILGILSVTVYFFHVPKTHR